MPDEPSDFPLLSAAKPSPKLKPHTKAKAKAAKKPAAKPAQPALDLELDRDLAAEEPAANKAAADEAATVGELLVEELPRPPELAACGGLNISAADLQSCRRVQAPIELSEERAQQLTCAFNAFATMRRMRQMYPRVTIAKREGYMLHLYIGERAIPATYMLRASACGDGKTFVAATVCCRDRRGRFLLTQWKGIDAVFARLQASSSQSAEAEQVSLEELIQREQTEQDAFEKSIQREEKRTRRQSQLSAQS